MADELLTDLSKLVVPNPHLTLHHCVSRSERLLSTRRCWLHQDAPVTSVVLNGVAHLGNGSTSGLAVQWDVSSGERGLTLMATELSGPVGLISAAEEVPTGDRPWVVVVGDNPPMPAQGDVPLLNTRQVERLRAVQPRTGM